MQEKRKSNRLITGGETFLCKDDGQKTGARLIDISLGGMRVLMNEELKVGAVLLGKFNILSRSAPFYVKGEVAWSKPCQEKDHPYSVEIGIKFIKINTLPI
jgi:hypothetical protein